MECDNLLIRLQKYLSQSGIASRRTSEEMIKQGRVKVNDKVVREMGIKIDPLCHKVKVDNKIVRTKKGKTYIKINKPKGYISSVSDPFNRPTVIDLIEKDLICGLHPVGRLDYDSEGLIIITNDGALTYKLTHPKYEISKTYVVEVKGIPASDKINKLRKGVEIENGIFTMPAHIKIKNIINNNAILEIIIREGKKRQIRKMCESIDHPVVSLKRTKIGELTLGDLPLGEWRFLNEKEIQYLKGI